MSTRVTESATEADVAVASEPADRRVAAAGAGRLSPNDVLRLQRTVGNRAVGRIAAAARTRSLQRASPEERPMVGPAEGGKTDELLAGTDGTKFQWDAFDRTLTIYTPKDGPSGGQAYQLTYVDGTEEELAKRKPEEIIQNAEVLSPLRAEAMEWLRTSQGRYQETEGERKTRVDNAVGRPTLCYQHTGAIATVLSDGTEKGMGGMDPRKGAMKGLRAGAFHTLESHPKGPRPGDIVSYGQVLPAARDKTIRQANFFTVLHIGIFKSRRKGPGDSEIWTVVDGGQGKFEGRQETRERTRTFTRERLEVAVPTKFFESGPYKGSPSGWEKSPEVIDCGVLKSKKADAGQSADDKLLRGWLDIDEYFGGGSAPTDMSGVNNRVFVGNAAAAVKP
ncbi:MAG: hypothetical protein QOD44_2477 [Solirubrobacteraceae bacterium]|nr:hypothetical protein [Solirubrobacteraceae bacterium]